MIQELLGVVEGRNININLQGGHLPDVSSSFTSTPISSPSSSPSPISSSEPQQNLKCPRCDSSNTKFCYYNNYNLTQPRHFCKTCRRYWTKGGALRNVPIGGGCRRGKPSPPLANFRSGSIKVKPAPPNMTAQDRELPACPVLWASPYSSQLLALLRASQLQNPNPSPLMRIKDDNAVNIAQLAAGPYQSLWKNIGGEYLNQNQQYYQHNMMGGSSVYDGVIQKMRSSPANYYTEQLPAVMGSASSCSPAPLATIAIGTNNNASNCIMEPLPLSGGDFGYWNAGFLG